MNKMLSGSHFEMLEWSSLNELETPCYVYSCSAVNANFNRLKSVLQTALVVSLKANPSPALLERCGNRFTDGIEIASLGELKLAIGRAKVPFIVNSPSLDWTLIEAACSTNATIVFDSLDQIGVLVANATSLPQGSLAKLKLGLRINATSLIRTANTSHKIDHFGVRCADIATAGEMLSSIGSTIETLHTFGGSYSFRKYGHRLVGSMLDLVKEVRNYPGFALKSVGLGGGFSETDLGDEFRLGEYRKLTAKPDCGIKLYHEAGRALFSAAGIFVVRVVHVKALEDAMVAVCDGGLAQNFLLAGTENVLRSPPSPRQVLSSRPARVLQQMCHVVGPSCNGNDQIGTLPVGSQLPERGDFLVFANTGAYNATYSPSHFLQSRQAREYLIA